MQQKGYELEALFNAVPVQFPRAKLVTKKVTTQVKRKKGTIAQTKCHDPGSNGGPLELQSTALPAELLRLCK